MATEYLRWPSYSSSISASVNQFWMDGSFTDMTLAVPGTVVSAHRAVLAARSAGLRRLLLAAGPEEPAPLLFLRGVTADQLHLLLQLLYTGSVVAGRQQLGELIELCKDLEIGGLEENTLTPVQDEKQTVTTQFSTEPKVMTEAVSVDVCKPVSDAQSLLGNREYPTPVAVSHLIADNQTSSGHTGDGLGSTVDTSGCEAVPGQSPNGALLLSKHSTDADEVRSPRPYSLDGSVTCGSAGLRQLASLLDSLDRGERVWLKRMAEEVLFPDFTIWLPDEILMAIMSWLSPGELLNAAGVCRRWKAVTADESVWRRCCRRLGAEPADQSVSSRQLCMHRFAWTEQRMPPPKRLKGHESVIRCMAVHGDRIVTGSSDKTLGVWSASRGGLERFMRGQGEITCVQMTGDLVVSASRDCSLAVWNAATGLRMHWLMGHTGIVWSVAVSGASAASGGDDKTVRLWDLMLGSALAVLRGHGSVVRAVCFDGLHVVSGDDDGCVRVWNAGTHSEEDAWQARSHGVMSLQHGFGMVVSGHGDGSINVWDMYTRQLRFELRAHRGWVTDLWLDEDRIVSGCKDGAVILWGLRNGYRLHTLSGASGHRQRVTAVRLLAGLAVTSSRDGRVKLWDCQRGTLVRDLVTPEISGGPVKHLWVGPGRLICSVQNNASDRPQVLVFDVTP